MRNIQEVLSIPQILSNLYKFPEQQKIIGSKVIGSFV